MRNAVILSAVAQLFSLPMLRGVPETPVDVSHIWAFAGFALLVAAITGPLMLVAWIFKVLGWWNMRKSGWRRGFYTVAWLAVTFGPVAAFFFFAAGAVVIFLEALPFVGDALTISPTAFAFMVAGALITAIASAIEGVASLDVGLLTKVKLLSVGSALYVAVAFLGALSSLVAPRGNALLLTLATNVVGLAASVLLAIGFHQARGVVTREAQRKAAGAA